MEKITQKQLNKIQEIADIMNKVDPVLWELEKVLNKYEEIKPLLKIMEDYYSSKQWFVDKDLSDKWLIDEKINQGALSEDGIWNILTLETWLLEIMKNNAKKLKK